MSRNTIVNENLNKKMNEKLSANSKTGFENRPKHENHEDFEETPTWAAVVTVLGYAVLSVLGWLRDFLRNIGMEEKKTARDPNPKVFIFYFKLFINYMFCFYEDFCSTLSKLRMFLYTKFIYTYT